MSLVNKRKRFAYDVSFKLKVIKYAESCNNNRNTATKFSISEKQVRDWRKNKFELLQMPRNKKALRGVQPAHIDEEHELNDWVVNLRQDGYIVTRSAIRLKAKELITDPAFKASAGWCARFMKRNKLKLRQKTKICQKLPACLDDKIISFQRYVINLRPSYEDILLLSNQIQQKTRYSPTVAIICGSGLGGIADIVGDPDIIPYTDIPEFPRSSVSGHVGQLVFGNLAGHQVVVMQGRSHLYEGYPASRIAVPVRTFRLLGVKVLIVTNASGGINRSFSAGDIMIIKDHLGFPACVGFNPLIGPNDELFGVRFPAMSDAYDKQLRKIALTTAVELNMDYVREGVYSMLMGPMYETIAESKFLQMMGADATGMSTVPEVIAARHCGMRVLGISLVTNMVVLEYESEEKSNHEEVLATAKKRTKDLIEFVSCILSKLEL